jgi:hypothetical protein
MQHVEVFGLAAHRLHQQHVRRNRVADRRVEAQRAGPDRLQFGGRDAVATGKQGDVMPHLDELLRQEGDDALRAAIQLRRDGFVEGSDLRDTHRWVSPYTAPHHPLDRGMIRALLATRPPYSSANLHLTVSIT